MGLLTGAPAWGPRWARCRTRASTWRAPAGVRPRAPTRRAHAGRHPDVPTPACWLQITRDASLCVDGHRCARMLNRCTESEGGQDRARPVNNCPMQTENGRGHRADAAALLPRPIPVAWWGRPAARGYPGSLTPKLASSSMTSS